MYKIGLIGDPHIQPSNLQICNIALKELMKYFSENPVDFIVVLGDILHTHEKHNAYAQHFAHKFLLDLKNVTKHIFLLIGNHDRPKEDEYLTDLHVFNPFKYIPGITIVDTVIIKYIKNSLGTYSKFVFTPYVSPTRFLESLASYNLYPPFDSVVHFFSHQEIKNCAINKLNGQLADEWLSTYPSMSSGHIHHYEEVAHNWLYPGSLLQLKDNDIIKKSISVIHILPPERLQINLEENCNDFLYSSDDFIEEISISSNSNIRNYLVKMERIYLNIPKKFSLVLSPEELKDLIIDEKCNLTIKVKCCPILYKQLLLLDNVKKLINDGANIININNTKLKYISVKPNVQGKIKFSQRIINKISQKDVYIDIYNDLLAKN